MSFTLCVFAKIEKNKKEATLDLKYLLLPHYFTTNIRFPQNKIFQSQIINFFVTNLYVLCTTQAQKAPTFGARINKPVDVVLKRREEVYLPIITLINLNICENS